MAQGFQADSCSTTAQTSAGSSDCATAALRARVSSCDGTFENIIPAGNLCGCTAGIPPLRHWPEHEERFLASLEMTEQRIRPGGNLNGDCGCGRLNPRNGPAAYRRVQFPAGRRFFAARCKCAADDSWRCRA